MFEAAGCKIPEEQMKRWTETFLPKVEPFFIDDDHLQNELEALRFPVYSRSRFSSIAGEFIGHYGANYNYWGIPAKVAIAYFKAIDIKDSDLRSKLFTHQAALGRGQIYRYAWVEEVDASCHEKLKESHSAANDVIILTHDAWVEIPENIKQRWLLKWLGERIEPAMQNVKMGHVPEYSERLARCYASTFPPGSGANCFSAAIGAFLGDHHIVENWLNIEQFFEIVNKSGLRKHDEITQMSDMDCFRAHDVLVWENRDGVAIHAAYAISDQVLFNKMGQFWFQPWQFVCLEQVFDYAGCLTKGGRISIYRLN
jgi:hypothetical protein